MPFAIIFVVIAAVIAIWSGTFKQKESALPVKTPSVIEKQQPTISEPSSPTFAIPVDTFIKYGPLQGEVINDTNRVVFEFGAKTIPEDSKEPISFETKLEGIDQDWQKSSLSEKIIDLPLGPREYTFLVRAKTKNFTDPTPAQRTFKLSISPYFQKIRISNVSPPQIMPSWKPSLITLASQMSDEIDITGFQLYGSSTQKSFVIPQAVEKYDSANPSAKANIIIKNNDRILISGASGPIFDVNFRPNKCLGYLSDRKFTIPIYQSCPRPREDRLPRHLSQTCQDYIKNRPSCQSVNSERLKEWGLDKDDNCLSYIESTFTYPGCFLNYSNDPDFMVSEWHIYLNLSNYDKEILDFNHDSISLFDKDGFLIDKYKY